MLPGVGAVERWCELVDVRWPLVTFRETCVFVADGAVLTSESSLRSASVERCRLSWRSRATS